MDDHCNCCAGKTGECKHTGAVVLFVNNEREESKTDKEQEWNKPSDHGRALYPKGQTIDDIICNPFPVPKRSHKSPNDDKKDKMVKTT